MAARTGLRWEGFVSGVLVGAAATLLALMGWHHVTGQLRLNAFRRAVESANVRRLAALMDRQFALADAALEEGRPLPASEWLADSLLNRTYAHHTQWARHLLERAERERFNSLRANHRWLILDLSRSDLEGHDLRGVDLTSVSLAGANLSHADLSESDLSGAVLAGADLSGAVLGSTRLFQADLSGARLNEVTGDSPDLREAVLAAASLTRVSRLHSARFERAVLSDANLWLSSFPESRFDGADLTLASAVDADFTGVASMADVTFTGANLSGTRVRPELCPRAWLVGATGLPSSDLESLRRRGAVVEREDVIALVDPRVVAGFTAQLEADPGVPPGQRRALLLEMLHEYYQR